MTSENKGLTGRCVFVALGSFNPAILHPQWFSRHSIMPAEEIEGLLAEPFRKEIPEIGATIEFGSKFLVEPNQVIIHFKSFSMKVDRGKFEVRCEQKEKIPLLFEFIKKIFMILPETPVSAYGINFDEHIKFKENANTIIDKYFTQNKLVNSSFDGGCTFGHKIFTKRGEAKITFKIEPSLILADGVFINVNFHYENKSSNNDFIVKMIDKNFADNKEFTENIISHTSEIQERVEKL